MKLDNIQQPTKAEQRQLRHTLDDNQIAKLKKLAIDRHMSLRELVTDALAKLAERGE